MPRRIMRAFKLSEISAVDRPAQAHARMAIMKRMTDKLADADSAAGKIVSFFLDGQLRKAASALGASLRSIIGDAAATNKPELVEQSLKQFVDHVDGLASDVHKAIAGDPGPTGDTDMNTAAIKKALGLADSATDDEVTAAVIKIAATETKAKDAEIAKLKADLEIAKAGMGDDEKAYHDGLKDDAEKAAFRGASKEDRAARMRKRDDLPDHIKKALAKAEDNEKRLAKLEDEQALVGFTKQAADAGLPQADGATIQKAYRGDKESVDKLVGYIKAANNAAKAAGLFKELGDGRTGQALKAYDELMAKADELRKKETSLTKEQAFSKVYSDPSNADLVRRERMESASGAA